MGEGNLNQYRGQRRRTGAQYDQNNQVINYDANGNVTPPGVAGVGSARPSQPSDATATPTSATPLSEWQKLFPRNPDGSARTPAPAAAPSPAPAPATRQIDKGWAAIIPQLRRPSAGPTPPPPQSPEVTAFNAAMPRPVQDAARARVTLANNPVVSLPNGEAYHSKNTGLEIDYDPAKDTTRKVDTFVNQAHPDQFTRAMDIDPRYGGGRGYGKTNGGAFDERDTDLVYHTLPDGEHVPDPTAAQVAAWRALMPNQPTQPAVTPTPAPTPAPAQVTPKPVDPQVAAVGAAGMTFANGQWQTPAKPLPQSLTHPNPKHLVDTADSDIWNQFYPERMKSMTPPAPAPQPAPQPNAGGGWSQFLPKRPTPASIPRQPIGTTPNHQNAVQKTATDFVSPFKPLTKNRTRLPKSPFLRQLGLA